MTWQVFARVFVVIGVTFLAGYGIGYFVGRAHGIVTRVVQKRYDQTDDNDDIQ